VGGAAADRAGARQRRAACAALEGIVARALAGAGVEPRVELARAAAPA